MKMKKWLAVLMTLAVTTAGLAGCGASDKPAAQQESAEKTEAAETVSGETGSSEQAGGEKVRIKLFTGKIETIDVMDDAQAYIELIKENISYEHHMKYDKYGQRELYDELFEVICEVVCVKRQTIRVAGEEYPYELVKSRFLKLNSGHLEYVIGCMKETTTKITNIKAYMVTALYNAPTTINHFYQQEVQHDMYGGGWHEKGIV